MLYFSNSGVMKFHITPLEYDFIPSSFFKNKKFFAVKNDIDIWEYDNDFPTFLASGSTYFDVVASRDFFSLSKKEILNELNVVECDTGITPFDTLIGVSLSVSYKEGKVFGFGIPLLGDFIGKEKIKNLSLNYDFKSNIFGGYYGT